jgi:hypothetical protein
VPQPHDDATMLVSTRQPAQYSRQTSQVTTAQTHADIIGRLVSEEMEKRGQVDEAAIELSGHTDEPV